MFNPSDFLSIADHLLRFGGEAALRTAISRAYYACFLVARDRLGMTARKDAEVHREVIRQLHVGRKPLVANAMLLLRDMRNRSDYETSVVVSQKEAEEARALASSVLLQL